MPLFLQLFHFTFGFQILTTNREKRRIRVGRIFDSHVIRTVHLPWRQSQLQAGVTSYSFVYVCQKPHISIWNSMPRKACTISDWVVDQLNTETIEIFMTPGLIYSRWRSRPNALLTSRSLWPRKKPFTWPPARNFVPQRTRGLSWKRP